MRRALIAAGVAAITVLAAACGSSGSSSSSGSSGGSGSVTLRLGFLANVTHAPALVGIKKGFFTKNLGNGVTLKLTPFSTGTEESTALLAGQLDAAYVGPNPAIKAWQTSNGKLIKIISGAASGRRAGGEEEHHRRLSAQGPVAGHALAGQHPGRRAALLAEAAQPDRHPDRGRGCLDQAGVAELGRRARVHVRPDRRGLGARALRRGDGPGRRARAGQRGHPVAGRQVCHHEPGRDAGLPRRASQCRQRAAQGPDRGE